MFLSFDVIFDNLSNIVPYLASKFHKEQFNRMQLELFVSLYAQLLIIESVNLEEFVKISPKHIQINLVD